MFVLVLGVAPCSCPVEFVRLLSSICFLNGAVKRRWINQNESRHGWCVDHLLKGGDQDTQGKNMKVHHASDWIVLVVATLLYKTFLSHIRPLRPPKWTGCMNSCVHLSKNISLSSLTCCQSQCSEENSRRFRWALVRRSPVLVQILLCSSTE